MDPAYLLVAGCYVRCRAGVRGDAAAGISRERECVRARIAHIHREREVPDDDDDDGAYTPKA